MFIEKAGQKKKTRWEQRGNTDEGFPSPNLPFPLNLVQSTRKSGFHESKSDVSFSLFLAFDKGIGKKKEKKKEEKRKGKKKRWKAIARNFFFPSVFTASDFHGCLGRDRCLPAITESNKQTDKTKAVCLRA